MGAQVQVAQRAGGFWAVFGVVAQSVHRPSVWTEPVVSLRRMKPAPPLVMLRKFVTLGKQTHEKLVVFVTLGKQTHEKLVICFCHTRQTTTRKIVIHTKN